MAAAGGEGEGERSEGQTDPEEEGGTAVCWGSRAVVVSLLVQPAAPEEESVWGFLLAPAPLLFFTLGISLFVLTTATLLLILIGAKIKHLK